MGKDGRISDRVKPCQCRGPILYNARRIDRDGFPEDRRVSWKLSSLFEYVCERQIIPPDKFNPVLQWSDLSGYLLAPKFFPGRSSDHYCNLFGVRQHAQDILHDCKVIGTEGDHGVVGGKVGIANAPHLDYC